MECSRILVDRYDGTFESCEGKTPARGSDVQNAVVLPQFTLANRSCAFRLYNTAHTHRIPANFTVILRFRFTTAGLYYRAANAAK